MRREFLHFLCLSSIFYEQILVYQKSYLVNRIVTRDSVGAAISLVGMVRQPQALHMYSIRCFLCCFVGLRISELIIGIAGVLGLVVTHCIRALGHHHVGVSAFLHYTRHRISS